MAFLSRGLRFAGHLKLPAGSPRAGGWPALAMAGPMTSMKEETLPAVFAQLRSDSPQVEHAR